LRAALGASRGRLVRQLITEAILLAIAGGALGIVIARAGLAALSALAPAEIAAAEPATLNGWVLAFTFGVAVLTGIFCGVLPAFQSSHTDLNSVIRAGGAGALGGHSGRVGDAFVVAEIALSLILLAGAGLFLRGFGNLLRVDPGFRSGHLLTMTVSQPQMPEDAYEKLSREQQQDLDRRDAMRFQQLVERIERLPGVKSAAGVSVLPVASQMHATVRFAIEGHPETVTPPRPTAEYRSITPGYFSTVGMPLIQGRELNESDLRTFNVVINENMAKRFWPAGDALGQRVNMCPMQDAPCWTPIVGVVGNVHQFGLSEGPTLDVYGMGGWTDSLVIRTERDPGAVAAEARGEVAKFDSTLAVSHVETMDQVLSDSLAQQRFSTLLLGLFAALALMLAAVGIYGVVRRTREIGIRMALGAQPRAMNKMIIRRGIMLAVVGAAIGLAGALALTRVIRSLLFEVQPADPVILGGVTLLLFATVAAACWIPARRAMRVDPMAALRQE
jgi:putative ABC transport system permease protein